MYENNVTKFASLMESLAEEKLGHSDTAPHFSTNIDSAQNGFARRMFYPCIVMDFGDYRIITNGGCIFKQRSITIIFAQHVKDTANEAETNKTFNDMEELCDWFVTKIQDLHLHHTSEYPFLARFSVDGMEAERIQLESPALYGWALTMNNTEILCVSN